MVFKSQATDSKELHVWSCESPESIEQEGPFLSKYFETLEEGDAILDIGCGQGKLVKAL